MWTPYKPLKQVDCLLERLSLYTLCVVQRNPSSAGFETPPAGVRALSGLHGSDGENAAARERSCSGEVRTGFSADIQVRDAHLDAERHVSRFLRARGIDQLPVRVEHTEARIGIRALLCVVEDFVRAFLTLVDDHQQRYTVFTRTFQKSCENA